MYDVYVTNDFATDFFLKKIKYKYNIINVIILELVVQIQRFIHLRLWSFVEKTPEMKPNVQLWKKKNWQKYIFRHWTRMRTRDCVIVHSPSSSDFVRVCNAIMLPTTCLLCTFTAASSHYHSTITVYFQQFFWNVYIYIKSGEKKV